MEGIWRIGLEAPTVPVKAVDWYHMEGLYHMEQR